MPLSPHFAVKSTKGRAAPCAPYGDCAAARLGSSRGMETAGRVLLGAALVLAILGVAALALSKLGVDRLPATLTWRSDNVTVFVPIGLMLVASIVGTIVLNIFLRR